METTALLAAGAGAAAWRQGLQQAVNAYGWVLFYGILLMLVLLYAHYLLSERRRRWRIDLRMSLLAAAKRREKAENPEAAARVSMKDPQRLYSRKGMAVLAQTAGGLQGKARAALLGMLEDMGFTQTLARQMKSGNEDYLIELATLAGDLGMAGLADEVAGLLYAHRDNVELQFQGFLALSKMGSFAHIVRVCTDKDFSQTLSFRSLQQVLTIFTGDKEKLYAALLDAADPYVIRIAIKQAGQEKLARLAPMVLPFLDSDDLNVQIDSVRTLGALRYTPAAEKIAVMLGHPKWEVRSVAATALASVNADAYIPQLVQALQDSEWQVRYNAATALQNVQKQDEVRRMVAECGDKYALEMYEYMAKTSKLWRAA